MDKAIDVQVERGPAPQEPPESYFIPATDVYEARGELVLVADMPGVKPDGLKITVEDRVLEIRLPKKEASKAQGAPGRNHRGLNPERSGVSLVEVLPGRTSTNRAH